LGELRHSTHARGTGVVDHDADGRKRRRHAPGGAHRLLRKLLVTAGLRGPLGSVHVLREGGLGRLHETGEGRGFVDREVGEDATVDLDAREAEALDEAVVGDAVRAGSGVDALDPQTTELALLRVTVAVGVDERVGDLLLRLAIETRALAAVAL